MTRAQKIVWLAMGIALVALGVRLPGLGAPMTADEGNWMIRSAQFYDALLAANPGGTFLTTHPGSTAMWLIGAGETWQERRLGLAVDESTLSHFRVSAVTPIVVASSLLIGIITALLAALVGWPAAAAGGFLLAVEPYVIGMTRIAHLDGLMGLLMLASAVAAGLGRWVLAGIFLGLAMGCKLILALWLWPVFLAIIVWHGWPHGVGYMVRRMGFVVGVAALTFWLSWPALWVKDDIGRSLTRDYRSVATDEHVALAVTEDPLAPQSFYVRTTVGRLTPFVAVLVLGALVWCVVTAAAPGRHTARNRKQVFLISWLLLYSVGFLILITLAAKKADRYALPALVVWPVVAGWAAVVAGHIAERRFPILKKARPAVMSLIFIAVGSAAVWWIPQTLAYNNPFFLNIRPLSQQGWGEGLEEAAAWLNERPNATAMHIASWYPSVMQTYFVGKALSLSSRSDYRVQYVVTYRNMGGRGPDDRATAVLEEVRDQQPVHTVFIHGVPYVWIYDTHTLSIFTRHVGEIFGDRMIGQTVWPESASWRWVDIVFATFSSRVNTEDIILHIRRSPQATEDLRRVRIKAGDIVDNEWHRFEFEPITAAAGQTFYVVLDSPTSVPGNAVTIRYLDADVRPGQMYVNGQPKEGDIAYRTRE